MDVISHAAFPLFALSVCFLVVKMIILGHWTAGVRFAEKTVLNPEDASLAPMIEGIEVGSHETEKVDRFLRAHRNHLESTLPFFVVGWLYLATNPALATAKGLFIAFVLLRTLYTICYCNQLQPWRSLAFLAGEVCIIVMIYNIVMWAL